MSEISGYFRSIQIFFLFKKNILQNGFRWPFWMSENNFWSHFWPFQIDTQLFILKFLTKWLSSAILDVRNSLWITFLAILDQYRFLFVLNFFYKMAAGGHFGCPKITFDLISIYFRSICNSFFFKSLTKWLTSAILDVRISLSIAFLVISDKYSL